MPLDSHYNLPQTALTAGPTIQPMPTQNSLYATCASGLQHLLADELVAMGLSEVNVAGAGVRFGGGLPAAYKACMWSRIASRVLLPIHTGNADSPEALYDVVQQVDWSKHMNLRGTVAVDFFTANSTITHSQYGALKVKDAIVDQFREATGERPNVERDTPDLRVNVYLYRNKARIAIDLSGSSLHRRGYREHAGPAPVKENLAASLLLACDWPARSQSGEAFADPLCGSGTLVIEAAMIACNIAPGLARSYYGFLGWLGHDDSAWNLIKNDAQQAPVSAPCSMTGSDQDAKAIQLAIENAELAGVSDAVSFTHQNIRQATSMTTLPTGLLVTNPPYGERLSIDHEFYTDLGRALSRHYDGWHCGLFAAVAAPIRDLRLPLKPSLSVRNGSIDCELYQGDIPRASGSAKKELASNKDIDSADNQKSPSPWDSATNASSAKRAPETAAALPAVDATPFANRLKKNARHLKSWCKREQVHAFRVYDSDLPEFAVAVDVYDCDERHVVVQEYQAPATVNTEMARARLKALMLKVPECLNVSSDNIHLKTREKQSGLAQYEKQSAKGITAIVDEYDYRLELNFSDYLDTGLFLDHRKVRRYIQGESAGKRFLNLFAYTGSGTIAAVSGGAAYSVSVDLSNRYCQWATRNLRHNQYDENVHAVIKSDVSQWLANNTDTEFDLILLDPPTFSNSTGIDADWNVQRDHVSCIDACMNILSSNGTLIFSNNYRRFKLDKSLSAGSQYNIEDKSRWSIDQDFQRNTRIHQCWFITHKH